MEKKTDLFVRELLKNPDSIQVKNSFYFHKSMRNQNNPWLSAFSSRFYDYFMKNKIFPKKFKADYQHHQDILKSYYRQSIKQSPVSILDIACGNGLSIGLLPSSADIRYCGLDISPGLLQDAVKKSENFSNFSFFLASASDIPFKSHSFGFAMCHLSFNFFDEPDQVIREIIRVLKPGAVLFGSVPISDKTSPDSKIRGNVLSSDEFKSLWNRHGKQMSILNEENGALIYFEII